MTKGDKFLRWFDTTRSDDSYDSIEQGNSDRDPWVHLSNGRPGLLETGRAMNRAKQSGAKQSTSVRTGYPEDRATGDSAQRPDGGSVDPDEAALDEELAYAIVTDAPIEVIRDLESRIRACAR